MVQFSIIRGSLCNDSRDFISGQDNRSIGLVIELAWQNSEKILKRSFYARLNLQKATIRNGLLVCNFTEFLFEMEITIRNNEEG